MPPDSRSKDKNKNFGFVAQNLYSLQKCSYNALPGDNVVSMLLLILPAVNGILNASKHYRSPQLHLYHTM